MFEVGRYLIVDVATTADFLRDMIVKNVTANMIAKTKSLTGSKNNVAKEAKIKVYLLNRNFNAPPKLKRIVKNIYVPTP